MVKTRVSSKGQTTIPAKFRLRWKASEVVWDETSDGGAIVRPVPDIMALYGSAHSPKGRDEAEMQKGREGWAQEGKREGQP